MSDEDDDRPRRRYRDDDEDDRPRRTRRSSNSGPPPAVTVLGVLSVVIGALSLLTLPPGRRAIFLKCGSAAAVLGLGTLALAPSFDIAM